MKHRINILICSLFTTVLCLSGCSTVKGSETTDPTENKYSWTYTEEAEATETDSKTDTSDTVSLTIGEWTLTDANYSEAAKSIVNHYTMSVYAQDQQNYFFTARSSRAENDAAYLIPLANGIGYCTSPNDSLTEIEKLSFGGLYPITPIEDSTLDISISSDLEITESSEATFLIFYKTNGENQSTMQDYTLVVNGAAKMDVEQFKNNSLIFYGIYEIKNNDTFDPEDVHYFSEGSNWRIEKIYVDNKEYISGLLLCKNEYDDYFIVPIINGGGRIKQTEKNYSTNYETVAFVSDSIDYKHESVSKNNDNTIPMFGDNGKGMTPDEVEQTVWGKPINVVPLEEGERWEYPDNKAVIFDTIQAIAVQY